jgi:hypothetical protein
LQQHLAALRVGIPKWIPDPDWAGNAMLDFEAWDPVYAHNTASNCGFHGSCYQTMSIKLVKEAHPSWTSAQVAAEAETQFNSAALDFFVQTLKTCQSIRPKAKWGYCERPLLHSLFTFPLSSFFYPWRPFLSSLLATHADCRLPMHRARTAFLI